MKEMGEIMKLISLSSVFALLVLDWSKVNCQKIKGCYYKGKHYRYGAQIPTGDACKKCKCDARLREPLCAVSKCSLLLCGSTFVPEGHCCPRCACKDTSGNIYKPGEKFKSVMKVNGMAYCLECHCHKTSTGTVAKCRRPLCLKKACASAFLPEGKCCPTCKKGGNHYRSCKYNFEVKSHGSKWNVGNCYKCTCQDGVVECLKNCPILSCIFPVQKSGDCCPKCPDQARGFPKLNTRFPFPFPGTKSSRFPFPKSKRDVWREHNWHHHHHYRFPRHGEENDV